MLLGKPYNKNPLILDLIWFISVYTSADIISSGTAY